MRITLKGEVERSLIELCQKLNASPTEILTNRIFDLEKQITRNRTRTEEVKNELQKPRKTIQES